MGWGSLHTLHRLNKKIQTRSMAALHTVVNNNAWDTQRFLDLREYIGNGAGIGEVSRDVDLVGCAVGLGRFPRGKSNAVAFRCKGFGYTRADSGASAKDENDGGCGRHGAAEKGRMNLAGWEVWSLVVGQVLSLRYHVRDSHFILSNQNIYTTQSQCKNGFQIMSTICGL